MSIITALLATAAGKWLVGLLGVVIALVVSNFSGRLSGAKKERQKQASDEAKAHDIANEVQNDIGAIPPDKARQELGKWAR
ncbi:MAG: hypothetical protein ACTHJQ_25480 [Rhizobiaceae bacterium]